MIATRVAALLVLFLMGAACTHSSSLLTERDDFGRRFHEQGAAGTFVLYDLQSKRFLVHDARRAQRRTRPASTFKIPNSLIALETGAIADTSSVLTWDGQERDIPAWNRDHSMTSAFRSSVVWYYKEAARRIGEDRMRDCIRRIGYGNGDISGGIDRFWLSGGLRINAVEQVNFLVRLDNNDLPFSVKTMSAVKGIMVEEVRDDYLLRSKTGWSSIDHIGWYVGYLERKDNTYFFTLNMDMDQMEQAPLRKQIARAILKDLGLI